MIFVTVGTHEQPFDRLLREFDLMKKNNIITERVMIQTGYSKYEPMYCEHVPFLTFDAMMRYMSEASIIVTHGGPSSFLEALQLGKIPIVVPRQKKYHEHVNNHQLIFANEVEKRLQNIVVVDDITTLPKTITNYQQLVSNMTASLKNNNKKFNSSLEAIVNSLV